jgi:hypothetical protein
MPSRTPDQLERDRVRSTLDCRSRELRSMLVGTVAGAVSVVLALLISPETKGKVFLAELTKL